MSTREDLYIILEIARGATVNDIKKAFRRLARRYHPDINPGDRTAEERFKRISEAYEVLSDPLKRQFYDSNGFYSDGVLEPPKVDASWGFSFEGFDFSRSQTSGFSDTIGQFFNRQNNKREPERGQDLEYQMSIGFEDSLKGFKTTINAIRRSPCPSCKGSGRALPAGPGVQTSCPACGGAGKLAVSKGRLHFSVGCSECGGVGHRTPVCPDCRGDGRISHNESIEIEIPSGVSTGSRIRFPGKGDAGRYGGPPGDLYFVTNVAAHPFFKRAGDNLQCTVPISFSEAALGAKIEVPTVDGPATVRIPPGTQNNQVFRLRGKGAPSLIDGSVRGDQYVEVRIVVPRVADERSKEILREFAKLNPENPRKEIWK
jgi:molecular chaperone DnaJ